MRLRFLREARVAASIRHQNVASVLHLGRTGQNYFYAMEFVEGETLQNLIKRAGRLETKLALEIATQVIAGLAAVHEQNLVHRDIKPTNIMVRLKEEGAVTSKIIDLGLAKTVIAEKEGSHRLQSQDATKVQDSSQDGRQIPSRQSRKGRGFWGKEVVQILVMFVLFR